MNKSKHTPHDPLPPTVAAYVPYNSTAVEDPIFEQVHLQGVHDWPNFEVQPWRFDTAKVEQCTIMAQTIGSLRIWDSIFVRCDLSANRLFGAGLLRSEFLGCRATGMQMGESTIKDVSFQNCKLNMSSFRKCKIERVVFENCILDDVDFNNATLTDVVFTKCELNRTDFGGSKSLRVDMTTSDIGMIRGVQSLRNVQIRPEQMIQLAPLLCAEIGIVTA